MLCSRDCLLRIAIARGYSPDGSHRSPDGSYRQCAVGMQIAIAGEFYRQARQQVLVLVILRDARTRASRAAATTLLWRSNATSG